MTYLIPAFFCIGMAILIAYMHHQQKPPKGMI